MKTDIKNKRITLTKHRKNRTLLSKILTAVITVIITTSLIYGILAIYGYFNPTIYDSGFIPAPYGAVISKKVQRAKNLEIPDWIDSQIIDIHSTARTGFRLSDIKNVVIHYVGNPNTTAQNNRDYFNKITTSVSSHFIVGLDGEIIQCVPLYERSAASNDRNKDTISIEVCHPDESGKFNDKTYDSVIKLISWLLNEFSLDENDIIRHYDITEKICPKYYVENEDEWINLKSDVKKQLEIYNTKKER